MVTTAGILVTLVAIAGVLITLLTLPGVWIAIAGALLAQWWRHGHDGMLMYSWWTLGACVGLGLAGEIAELLASAVGTTKAGGTTRGALGSVVGGLLGAVIGTVALWWIPVVGTLVGATLGAGLGAVLVEKHAVGKTWAESGKVGAGAAAGRLAATVAKVCVAGVVAVVLGVASFV